MIVTFYAGLLGILYFIISIEVIKGRRSNRVAYGNGESNEIVHLVSAHSNFAAYTPLFLIVLYFLEGLGLHFLIIHLLGLTFLIGRTLHFIGLKNRDKTFNKRVLGMHLTLWPLLGSSVLLIVMYIYNYYKA